MKKGKETPQDAEMKTTMTEPRPNVIRLQRRIRRHDYVVDERAVAAAMLSRPLMRLFLAPRGRRLA